MDIDEYGFLGKDIKQYENKLAKKYKEVFDFDIYDMESYGFDPEINFGYLDPFQDEPDQYDIWS